MEELNETIRIEVKSLLAGYSVNIPPRKLQRVKSYFKRNYPKYKIIKSKEFSQTYYIEA